MRETGIERRVRDVRITTIYEGTSQIQIAASLKSILADVMKDEYDEWARGEYPDTSGDIAEHIAECRRLFYEYLEILKDHDNPRLNSAAAKDLADTYSSIFGAYLLLRGAAGDPDRESIAREYAIKSYSLATSRLAALRKGAYDKWRNEFN
jgi:hypothetical protein